MSDNKQPKSPTKKQPKPKLGPVPKGEKVLAKSMFLKVKL